MANLARLAPPGSEGERLLQQLDLERLPRHVALIMDGNGRWARSRRLPRIAGHRAGIASVRDVVEACGCLGLQVLTVYAFSKENWKRPKAEVDFLMDLLREYVRRELDELHGNRVRIQVIGRMHELPPAVQDELHHAIDATQGNDGLVLNLALSYGGRAEIVDACRTMIREGVRPDEVDEASFARRLYTAGQPEPDLVVRTGGELRVSNFLLWQLAYAELVFVETLWPDFGEDELRSALEDYASRRRRFGGR